MEINTQDIQRLISTDLNDSQSTRLFISRLYYNSIFLPKKSADGHFPSIFLKLHAVFKTPHMFKDGIFEQRRLEIPSIATNKNREDNLLPLTKINIDPGEQFKIEIDRKEKSFAFYLRLKSRLDFNNPKIMYDIYDKINELEKKYEKQIYMLNSINILLAIKDTTVFFIRYNEDASKSSDSYGWDFKERYMFT